MQSCKSCGHPTEPQIRFCRDCGKAIGLSGECADEPGEQLLEVTVLGLVTMAGAVFALLIFATP